MKLIATSSLTATVAGQCNGVIIYISADRTYPLKFNSNNVFPILTLFQYHIALVAAL